MKRTKAAAKSRRVDPLPGLTLNLEIAGVALLCTAALLALALVLPPGKAGFVGPVAASTLHAWFGTATWAAVAAIAVVGGIIFMELHVLRLMALFSACAAGEFIVIDALFGMYRQGGVVGNAVYDGVHALVGAGSLIVFGFFGLAFVVAPTGISIKQTLAHAGRAAAAIYAANASRREPEREAEPEIPRTIAPPPEIVEPALVAHAPTSVDVEFPHAPPEPAAARPETAIVPVQAAAPEVATQPKRKRDADQPARAPSGSGYHLPDLALFNPPEKRIRDESSAAATLEETLASFGVIANVTHIERGPSVTRYELAPGKGVKVGAIRALADNIQLALAAQSVRIEAPIPGKAAVGIEVPNSAVSIVAVREILDHLPRGENNLFVGLGKDITGRPIVADLCRMPHLLVAGATGAGKSVCLNVILSSLLSTCTPDKLQLVLIDPKRVEMTSYNGIPHLINECITDPKLAAGALYELTKEMDARYERFARAGVRKIEEYNAQFPDEPLPFIVVCIDELADLMLVAPTRVETSICRIAQLARATGIHLVVATQRPSVDVITGLIKANIPSRIAFAVSSQVDSRTILDMAGAERLLGRGDMLYLPIDAPKPVRVQGALVTGDEIERLCAFWREQDDPSNRIDIELTEVEEDGRGPADDMAFDAAKLIIERQFASVALLQAELKVGHPRAVRLMKILEDFRVVGPAEGTKPRKILVGEADVEQLATILAPRKAELPLL